MSESNSDSAVTLGLLNAVEENSAITQRDVAKDLGIALGLTNSYLKRCVKKGLIKIQQAPANRYAYYLTPSGFAEKSRLTAEYLSQGFLFFRLARNQCTDLFQLCEERGWRSIGIHGLTDLTEIAVLCADNFPLEIAGIIDSSSALKNYAGYKIVGTIAELNDPDAMLISDLDNPQSCYEKILRTYDAERILVPGILNVSYGIEIERE